MKRHLHPFITCIFLGLSLLGATTGLAQTPLSVSGSATATSSVGTSIVEGDVFNWSVSFDLDTPSTGSTPSFGNTFNDSVTAFSLSAGQANQGDWDPSGITWPITPASNVSANANGNQLTVQLRPDNAPDLNGLAFFDLGLSIDVDAAGLDPVWIDGSTNLATWLGTSSPDLSNATIFFELRDTEYSSAGFSAAVQATVDGVCGVVAATAFAPPAESLCTAGTADGLALAGTNSWTWSCNGSGGGETSICSAPYADTATGSGDARVEVTGDTWTVDADNSGFVAADSFGPIPDGLDLPHGLLGLRLTSGEAGTTATVTIHYPAPLAPGTVYWKYGRQASQTSPEWYVYPQAVISNDRMSIILTLTDGGPGDDDLAANGVISDPGGPGIAMSGAEHAIPSLSEWMIALLGGLVLLIGVQRMRRSKASRLT